MRPLHREEVQQSLNIISSKKRFTLAPCAPSGTLTILILFCLAQPSWSSSLATIVACCAVRVRTYSSKLLEVDLSVCMSDSAEDILAAIFCKSACSRETSAITVSNLGSRADLRSEIAATIAPSEGSDAPSPAESSPEEVEACLAIAWLSILFDCWWPWGLGFTMIYGKAGRLFASVCLLCLSNSHEPPSLLSYFEVSPLWRPQSIVHPTTGPFVTDCSFHGVPSQDLWTPSLDHSSTANSAHQWHPDEGVQAHHPPPSLLVLLSARPRWSPRSLPAARTLRLSRRPLQLLYSFQAATRSLPNPGVRPSPFEVSFAYHGTLLFSLLASHSRGLDTQQSPLPPYQGEPPPRASHGYPWSEDQRLLCRSPPLRQRHRLPLRIAPGARCTSSLGGAFQAVFEPPRGHGQQSRAQRFEPFVVRQDVTGL
ncbi:hypothetical protein NDU88_004084 [Pleurodeles waltl]|uniref:Uncharacterized protein n=1 Tax=Pleurodeles waltl TaxID=8319 RepID=A0AAV7MXI0_PLEWA|nr:hypothetical protein NDU88_004084 [Pleurodeles waltl]